MGAICWSRLDVSWNAQSESVCVCVNTCDCGSAGQSSEALMTLLRGRVCVCTPALSRVVHWDSDGYVCLCVKSVARLSNTVGM